MPSTASALLPMTCRRLRAGVRALHGDHRQVGARLDVDLERRRPALQPRGVLVARAGVHDDAEVLCIAEVSDQVVDHAAALVEHAAVERLAGILQLRDVVREQIAQVVARPRAADIGDEHVRDVEHAGVAPHGVMLFDLRAVVDRHVPAAEVHHAGARGDVRFVQRRLEAHRCSGLAKAKQRTAAPRAFARLPLCPAT